MLSLQNQSFREVRQNREAGVEQLGHGDGHTYNLEADGDSEFGNIFVFDAGLQLSENIEFDVQEYIDVLDEIECVASLLFHGELGEEYRQLLWKRAVAIEKPGEGKYTKHTEEGAREQNSQGKSGCPLLIGNVKSWHDSLSTCLIQGKGFSVSIVGFRIIRVGNHEARMIWKVSTLGSNSFDFCFG